MVELLFRGRPPTPEDAVLDPGCGTGEFIDGVIRWCGQRSLALPRITGVESDPRHLAVLRAKYENLPSIRILHADFLAKSHGTYPFIVGNPPYVAITELSESEKARYRGRYIAARGRFDLYLLFFEQALRSLARGGRLVFITPEKYLYVETAAPLRGLLARHHVEEIRFLPEDTFGSLVTYPTVTVVRNARPGSTRIICRDGSLLTAKLPAGDEPWLASLGRGGRDESSATLGDVCLRISCGVATGADDVFVRLSDSLDRELQGFAYPTVAGRQLTPGTAELSRRFVMLVPYDRHGRLLSLAHLGALARI